MKIRHLNCASMRPRPERLGRLGGSLIATGRMVAHCLLIETNDGLVLVDSGLGLQDVAQPARRLGKLFLRAARPQLDPHETAARQIDAAGYRTSDVRHIVLTHLDLDHAGGLADFPDATVHVYALAHRAALDPRGLGQRHRYRPIQWAHHPRWQLHDEDGEQFMGLGAVRAVVEPEVLLVPTTGHSPGHAAVAVRTSEGWLLHCGDAYFSRHEIADDPPACPVGLDLLQRSIASNGRERRANQQRIRELFARDDGAARVFCAHDPDELRSLAWGDPSSDPAAARR